MDESFQKQCALPEPEFRTHRDSNRGRLLKQPAPTKTKRAPFHFGKSMFADDAACLLSSRAELEELCAAARHHLSCFELADACWLSRRKWQTQNAIKNRGNVHSCMLCGSSVSASAIPPRRPLATGTAAGRELRRPGSRTCLKPRRHCPHQQPPLHSKNASSSPWRLPPPWRRCVGWAPVFLMAPVSTALCRAESDPQREASPARITPCLSSPFLSTWARAEGLSGIRSGTLRNFLPAGSIRPPQKGQFNFSRFARTDPSRLPRKLLVAWVSHPGCRRRRLDTARNPCAPARRA